MADSLRAPGPELLAALEAALGPGGVVAPEPRHLEEPRGRYHGTAAAVLRPADTAGVAAAVRLCAAARVGIVPYGGGTGLVGGQVRPLGPSDGPPALILALDRLDRIRALDTTDNVVVAEAGVVLADLRSPPPRPPAGSSRSPSPPKAPRGSAAISRPMPAAPTCCATATPATSRWDWKRCSPTAACTTA
jgi:hypothetical protein